jgi:hypothetical protein
LDASSPSQPRSLAVRATQIERAEMLGGDHIRPLTEYAKDLRARRQGSTVPDFDPLDGGIDAKILFLFEKPGPMTDPGIGSGFISRDNNDPTAEATFRFMVKAGIDRKLTVLWNLVPWWNGTRKVTHEEQEAGYTAAQELLEKLPNLRNVVLVGRRAGKFESRIKAQGIHVLVSDHPSPLVRARFRERWDRIYLTWRECSAVTS